MNIGYEYCTLGVTVSANMDFFLENFQTALTPPPPVPFWKLHCAFSRKFVSMQKICNDIFWIGDDPLPPPLLSFFGNYIALFPENPLSMRKVAMTFFGLAMTPLPPFWKLHCAFFPKYTALKPTKSAM